ncbi:MAG: FHA domain-containing protein [Rhodobacteraceae bacterium]|nr:FHA domain-containing protein [Paracoccaceae bacterium]
MIIVRVSAPGTEDRLAEVGTGIFTLGSGFDCDFALVDEGVAPRHLELEVSSRGVSVRLAGEAPAALTDRAGTRVVLVPGQNYDWYQGSSVSIGPLVITLGGTGVRPPPPEPTMFSKLARKTMRVSGRSIHYGLIAVGTLVATGLMAAGVFDFVAVEAGAREPEAAETAAAAAGTVQTTAAAMGSGLAPSVVAPAQPPTPEDLRAHLATLGVESAEIRTLSDGLHATIHVKTVRDREIVGDALGALPYPVEATIFAEDRLRAAVTTVLGTVPGDVALVSLDKGNLVLSGLSSDPTQRERVASLIRADVSGIGAVRFDDPVRTPADDLVDDVLAVWTGQRPHVVMSDGRKVRIGETMIEGIRLAAVHADGRITVDSGNDTHEIVLKK